MDRNNSAGDFPRHIKHDCLNKKLKFSWEKFSIIPSHVIFEKYREGFNYKKKIQIINQDSCLHQVNIKFSPPYPCDVTVASFGDHRIIPGLHVVIEISFSPIVGYSRNKIDRRLEIIVSSPTANYNARIPILIPSCMPKLNFPNEITFHRAVMGMPAYSTFWIFNMTDAVHTFLIGSEVFEIKITPDPKNTQLKPGDHKTFIVEWTPQCAGSMTCQLTVKFTNGKTMTIPVHCECVHYDIQIDQTDIVFPNTYLGLATRVEFNLINTGNSVVKFKWMKYDVDNELEVQHKVQSAYNNYLHFEEFRTNQFEYHEMIGDQNTNSVVLEQEFKRCKEYENLEFAFADAQFELLPEEGDIFPKSQILVTGLFRPLKLLPTNKITPITCNTKAYLKTSSNPEFRQCVNFEAVALGPDIHIPTKEVNLGRVFQSDIYVINIDCHNKGIIDAEVFYEVGTIEFESEIKVTPHHLRLRADHSGIFQMTFKTFKIGKFIETIYFRVENGEKLSVLLRGDCRALEMIMSPNKLIYGVVPMCIPQKKIFSLANPFNKPVKIVLSVERAGSDQPLKFDEFQRINTIVDKLGVDGITLEEQISYISLVCTTDEEEFECDEHEASLEEFETSIENVMIPFKRVKRIPSIVQSQVDYILEITENVIDFLETLFERVNDSIELTEFLRDLIAQLLRDTKTESEDIAESAIEAILARINQVLDGERDVVEYYDWLLSKLDSRNETIKIIEATIEHDILEILRKELYYQKDWTIAQNPIEYFCDPDTFIIMPHCKVAIDITLIPNYRGKHTNKLHIMATFYTPNEVETFVPKISSTESLLMQYECDVPKIKIVENQELSMVSIVEIANLVKITIHNENLVDGFCYLEEVHNDEIVIETKYPKVFIKGDEFLEMWISITPVAVGLLNYTGVINTLGNPKLQCNFKITVNSIPPQILFWPKTIVNQQEALVKQTYKVFLENDSPSIVPFTVKQKNEDIQLTVMPEGGILGPFQKLVILIDIYPCTPKLYKNTIIIKLKHFGTVTIPVKITVIGEPLLFMPPIVNGVCDFGTMFITNQQTKKLLTIKNMAMQPITLTISAKAIKPPPGEYTIIPNKLTVTQNRMTIPSTSECIIEFVLQPSPKAILIQEEFHLEKVVGKFKVLVMIFTVKCRIVIPSIQWNKLLVEFDLFYGDTENNRQAFERLTLRNNSGLPLDVSLTVTNPYMLIELEEAIIKEDLKFHLENDEIKEIYVDFDVSLVSCYNEYVEYPAKIRAKFGSFNLASVNLNTRIYYPEIRVDTNELNFISSDWINYCWFKITNTGRLDAQYSICVKNENYETNIRENGESQEDESPFIDDMLNIKEGDEPNIVVDDFAIDETIVEESDHGSDIEVEVQPVKKTKMKKSSKSALEKPKETKANLKKTSEPVPDEKPLEINEPPKFSVPTEIMDKWFFKAFKPVDHLDESKYTIPAPKIITIDHCMGLLHPTEERTIKIKTVIRDHTHIETMKLSASIEFNVLGGNIHEIRYTGIFSCMKAEISTDYINLGILAWYSIRRSSFWVTNLMDIQLFVTITKGIRYEKNGSIEISPFGPVTLEKKLEKHKFCLKSDSELVLGKLHQQIGVHFNNEPPIIVNIIGVPKIPTATILNVPRTGLGKIDRLYDYYVLKEFYNLWYDEHVSNEYRNNELFIKLNDLYAAELVDMPEYEEEEEALFMDELLSEYVYIENSIDDLPNAVQITSFLDQDIFTHCYNNSESVQQEFHRIKTKLLPKTNKHAKLEIKTIQPLPFTVPEYEYSMGDVILNTDEIGLVLPIYFHGPGPLNFALRTEIPIPELSFEFIEPKPPTNFNTNKYELDVKTRFYRNRFQREETPSLSISSQLILRHCHSYDFDSQMIHTRNPKTPRDWKIIKDYYSAYNIERKETRDPNTCCEIFQQQPFNSDGITIELKMVFRPTERHYWDGMIFDEIIYLDVHLGPIIPILLIGNIKKAETPIIVQALPTVEQKSLPKTPHKK